MSAQAQRKFIPALRFHWLTPLFDPVVALSTRERTFKARVIERAALADRERVLDLACGTGTLALAVLRQAPDAHVTGIDADPEILRQARKKARTAGVQIRFDEGFSTELPYGDGQFDAVLSTLFFHHLRNEEKHQTAAEIARVLKPGGRLVLGDVGRPQGPVMRLAVLATIQLVDGTETTSANVAGKLPGIFTDAGFSNTTVTDRLRTPTGTIEIVTGERPSEVQANRV